MTDIQQDPTGVAAAFQAAVMSGDAEAAAPLLAQDIEFYSPVKFSPFRGKPMVVGLLGVLLRTFEDFRYVGAFSGQAERWAGPAEPAEILLFRARVGEAEVHGIDLLHTDPDGLIDQFTVMVRPATAAKALSDAVLAGLIAAGLVPAA